MTLRINFQPISLTRKSPPKRNKAAKNETRSEIWERNFFCPFVFGFSWACLKMIERENNSEMRKSWILKNGWRTVCEWVSVRGSGRMGCECVCLRERERERERRRERRRKGGEESEKERGEDEREDRTREGRWRKERTGEMGGQENEKGRRVKRTGEKIITLSNFCRQC